MAQEKPVAPEMYEAVVTYVKAAKTGAQGQKLPTKVDLKITSGKLKDRKVSSVLNFNPGGVEPKYRVGQSVVVTYQKDQQGNDVVYITDYVRRGQLLLLFFVFMGFVFLIGRWKGLSALIGMVFSFVIIMKFIVPSIIQGNDPILIALLGSLMILPVSFYLSHGFTTKTTVSIVATFLTLLFTGVLAYLFVYLTQLTGFASEEAVYIQAMTGGSLNIKSLLLAGIIIGASGVLDDITISQTAIVEKLAEVNQKFTFTELYSHSMEVGRDHIASLVNTLVLVYTGASLPLFLLFYNSNLSYSLVLNQEIIATEIVRTLVSSIGIIAAVPLTTLLACLYVRKHK